MNLSIMVVGLSLAAMYFIPYALVARASSNSNKKLVKDLFTLAKKNNCSISLHDYWKNIALGIDKDHRKIFYVNKSTNIENTAKINLSEVQKCQIVNKRRNVVKNANSSPVTEKLGLIFTYLDKNKPDTFLEFYNAEYKLMVSDEEPRLIEKWAGIVNDVIANRYQAPKNNGLTLLASDPRFEGVT